MLIATLKRSKHELNITKFDAVSCFSFALINYHTNLVQQPPVVGGTEYSEILFCAFLWVVENLVLYPSRRLLRLEHFVGLEPGKKEYSDAALNMRVLTTSTSVSIQI